MVLIRYRSVDSTDSRQEIDLVEKEINSCKKILNDKKKQKSDAQAREREYDRDRDRRRELSRRDRDRDRDRDRAPLPSRKERDAPRGRPRDECYVCGLVGHLARHCPKRAPSRR